MIKATCNRTPPFQCRLLARKDNGRAPMSNQDLAEASGLARGTINKLGHMETWDNVTVGTMEKFASACGVNLLAPWRSLEFMRKRAWGFLGQARPAQRRMYDRLFKKLEQQAQTRVFQQ